MASVNVTPAGQSTPVNSLQFSSPGAAAAGPSFTNPDGGAEIVSDGDNIAVISGVTGDSFLYAANSGGFAVNRPRNEGERLGSLPSGEVGLDIGGKEIAFADKGRGDVKVLQPNGSWEDLGPMQNPGVEQKVENVINNREAFADLTNVIDHDGALGGIRIPGISKSSLDVLNHAKEMADEEKLRGQKAAQQALARQNQIDLERQDPAPAPILPLDEMVGDGIAAPMSVHESPSTGNNGPYLQSVETLSREPQALQSPLQQNGSTG